MPEATFVFETTAGSLFAVLPDAVVREDHGISVIATEQEVERGIATTDHVREEADRFGCEIVISNTPIRTIEGDPSTFYFGANVSSQPLTLDEPEGPTVSRLAAAGPPARGVELDRGTLSLPSVSTLQADVSPSTRTVDNWQILEDAKSAAWLATITTDLKTYRSMLLLSAEVTLTAQDGGWIRVELLFRELRQVDTILVDAAEPLQPRNRQQANDGSSGTSPEDEAASRPQSLLSQGLERIGGLL